MAQNSERIVGFFPGTFDLLHPGHVAAFKEAKEHCDSLLVGVNMNPTGKEPIYSWQERVEMLKSIKWIEEIGVYKDDKDLYELDKLGKIYRPNKTSGKAYRDDIDVRFMGADHKEVHHPIKAKVIKISRDHDYSSTSIKERCVRSLQVEQDS